MTSTGGWPLTNLYEEDITGLITPFDEDPPKRLHTAYVVNTGSLDTSAFDCYRQGVELSLDKYYHMSVGVKIHAGEPENDHRLRQSTFGDDTPTEFTSLRYFRDVDYFDPIWYLTAQVDIDWWYYYVSSSITFPILSPDVDESSNVVMNGIIEPLTIRSVVSFFSIEHPFESHGVYGELGDGSPDMTRTTSRVSSQYEFDTVNEQPPYIDAYGYVNDVPVPGYFSWDRSAVLPFDDQHDPPGLIIDSTNSALRPEFEAMRPDTDGYVPSDCVSMACGFTYDTTPGIGVDSIAFGGLAVDLGSDPYVH